MLRMVVTPRRAMTEGAVVAGAVLFMLMTPVQCTAVHWPAMDTASEVPPSDYLDPNCTCAQFCSKTCTSTNMGQPEQLVMYRLTPANVTELDQKDTGDAAGDLGFFLLTLKKIATCKPEQMNTDECFLAYRPTVRQFFVETDGKYGPYMRCNPLQFPGNQDMEHVDTRAWGCFPWHGRPPTPWIPTPSSPTSCMDKAYCPAIMNLSVGKDPAMHHAFNPSHPQVSSYFGGNWYSVTAQGQCPKGVAPGSSSQCSWRLQPGKTSKAVNATCMADRVMAIIETNGKLCYSKCPQPLDRKSECYFDCLSEAVIGSPGGNGPIYPVNRDIVISAWSKAFSSEDPSQGGCPNVDVV